MVRYGTVEHTDILEARIGLLVGSKKLSDTLSVRLVFLVAKSHQNAQNITKLLTNIK